MEMKRFSEGRLKWAKQQIHALQTCTSEVVSVGEEC